MATMSGLERVLGKALLDSDFRSRLLGDPQKAASSIRVKLTTAQVARIRSLDPGLVEWWAQGFQTLKGNGEEFLW